MALFIMAIISVLSAQTFNTAISSSDATKEAMDRLAAIDRTFVLIESDLRNAVPKVLRQRFGEVLPAMYVAQSDDYWMTIMRGGMANPLHQRRTEEVRVGYRYISETIWRDVWYNPLENEQTQALQRKLLTGVNDVRVRVLPNGPGSSVAGGPWYDVWPAIGKSAEELPIAVEVTLILEDMGEITRLFSLLPGKGPDKQPVANNPNQNNNSNQNNNQQGNDPNIPDGTSQNSGEEVF